MLLSQGSFWGAVCGMWGWWGWSQLHLLLTAESVPALARKEYRRFGPWRNAPIWWGRAGDKVSLLVWMSVVVKLASWAVSMTTAFCAGGRGHAPVISMKRTMRECTLFKAFIFQYVFEYNLEIGWIKGKVYFYAWEWGKLNWLRKRCEEDWGHFTAWTPL